jgi:hypothetical protein
MFRTVMASLKLKRVASTPGRQSLMATAASSEGSRIACSDITQASKASFPARFET